MSAEIVIGCVLGMMIAFLISFIGVLYLAYKVSDKNDRKGGDS